MGKSNNDDNDDNGLLFKKTYSLQKNVFFIKYELMIKI